MIGISLLITAIPKEVVEEAGGIMLSGVTDIIGGIARSTTDVVGGMLDDIASVIVPGYETSQRHKDNRAARAQRNADKAATDKTDKALKKYIVALEDHVKALEKRLTADEKAISTERAARIKDGDRDTAAINAERKERVRDIAALVARATALESKARDQLASIQRALDGVNEARAEAQKMGSQMVSALGQWFQEPRAESPAAFDDAERMLSAVDAGQLPGYLAAATGEYGLFDAEPVMGAPDNVFTAGGDDYTGGDDDEDMTAGLSAVGRL